MKEPAQAPMQIEEEVQNVNEEELIDKNGEFIIFSDQKQLGGSSDIVLPGDKVK